MPAPTENGREEDPTDDPDERTRRCVDLVLENGELVIYEAENHSAWIQSDGAVELAALA
jgi:hypothetical protein